MRGLDRWIRPVVVVLYLFQMSNFFDRVLGDVASVVAGLDRVVLEATILQ